MRVTVAMPRVADSIHDYLVSEVLVEVGDAVDQGAPILIVETDKVDSEVPATVAGVVREILVAADDEISVGTPIAVLETTSLSE